MSNFLLATKSGSILLGRMTDIRDGDFFRTSCDIDGQEIINGALSEDYADELATYVIERHLRFINPDELTPEQQAEVARKQAAPRISIH
jgi:hypothetical protein